MSAMDIILYVAIDYRHTKLWSWQEGKISSSPFDCGQGRRRLHPVWEGRGCFNTKTENGMCARRWAESPQFPSSLSSSYYTQPQFESHVML